MTSDNRPISLKVVGEGGMANPREAESIGLIATDFMSRLLGLRQRQFSSRGRFEYGNI